MPSLNPLPEGAETLTPLAEGAQTLTALPEGVQSLVAVQELVFASIERLGFFLGVAHPEVPYPYPGSISYSGDITGSIVGM